MTAAIGELEGTAVKAGGAVGGGFTPAVTAAGEASDVAAAKHGEHEAALSRLGDSLKEFATRSLEFTAGMAGFQVAQDIFESFKSAVIDFPDVLEKASITFETFTGSAQKAGEIVSQIQGLGTQTPFHTEALLAVSQTLVALGAPAEMVASQVKDIATAVASVGGGDQDLQGVALALARIQETGVLDARIMRQLTTDNIPAWNILAEAMHKTVPELQDMIKHGQITSDVFLDAFHTWATGDAAADALAKSVGTIGGAMTVFQNEARSTITLAVEPLTDRLTSAAVAAASLGGSGGAMRWARDIAQDLRELLGVLDGVDPKLATAAATFAGAVLITNALGPSLVAANAAILTFGRGEATAALATYAYNLAAAASIVTTDGLAAALKVAGAATYGLLGPLGLVAIAVGALAIGYETNFLGMKDKTDGLISSIDALGTKITGVKGKWEATTPVIAGAKTIFEQSGASIGATGDKMDVFSKAADLATRNVEGARQANARLRAEMAADIGVTGAYTDELGRLNQAIHGGATPADKERANEHDTVAAMNAQRDASLNSAYVTISATDMAIDAQKNLDAAAKSAGSSIAGIGTNALAALPGLSALDLAIAGTQQKLAAVQLQIEEKKFARMEAHPRSSLGGQEALLEEQLKIEQLEKAAGFTVAQEQIKIDNANTSAANSAASHARAVAAADHKKGLPHFAEGGVFDTPGDGGTDSTLVQFMATPGEPIAVGDSFVGGGNGGASAGAGVNVSVTVNVASGPPEQIAASAGRATEESVLRALIRGAGSSPGRAHYQLAGVR